MLPVQAEGFSISILTVIYQYITVKKRLWVLGYLGNHSRFSNLQSPGAW